MTQHFIERVEELEAVYGAPAHRSIIKEQPALTDPYRKVIEASPFLVLATAGAGGMDCSPRGDAPGFVRVVDSRTLVVPDRRGNNRIDSLRNIVEDPRVALIFLVPGMEETLRVNGTARISVEPELLRSFAIGDKLPRSCIVVTIDAVYFQCAKALVRSHLWDPSRYAAPGDVPTAGDMIKACDAAFDAVSYDSDKPNRVRETIY